MKKNLKLIGVVAIGVTIAVSVCLATMGTGGNRPHSKPKYAALITTIPKSAADSINEAREKVSADTTAQDTAKVDSTAETHKSKLHKFVDLGLPSGTIWAETNMESDHPADFGKYYTYNEARKACASTKHSMSSSKYDAPTLPTQQQYQELIDNCQWKWIKTKNSEGKLIAGYKITGKTGKILFLPASGLRGETDYFGQGSVGYYWTDTHDNRTATALAIYQNGYYTETANSILDGLQVRQVMNKRKVQQKSYRLSQ